MNRIARKLLSGLSLVLLAAFCASCAISPNIRDSTGLRPEDVVRSIRCEVRDAIIYKAAGTLQYWGRQLNEQDTIDLADDLAHGKISLAEALVKTHNKIAKAFITKYKNVAIAYEFTLDITEENKIDANVDFLGMLTHRVVNLGISGSNDLSRQNVVHFYITDILGNLVDDPQTACDRVRDVQNIEFPIAGRIGADKQVSTFFNLNELAHLSVSGIGGLDLDKLPTLAVTYNFQTTISGTVNPKVTVSPTGTGYFFKDFGLTANMSRKDFHKVIISMALPLNGKAPKPAFVPPGVILDPGYTLAVARAKTPQEVAALSAIADTKINQYLSRSSQ